MTPDEFIQQEQADGNLWWRLSSGEHKVLFEAAMDERNAAREELARLRRVVEAAREVSADFYGTVGIVYGSELRALRDALYALEQS